MQMALPLAMPCFQSEVASQVGGDSGGELWFGVKGGLLSVFKRGSGEVPDDEKLLWGKCSRYPFGMQGRWGNCMELSENVDELSLQRLPAQGRRAAPFRGGGSCPESS